MAMNNINCERAYEKHSWEAGAVLIWNFTPETKQKLAPEQVHNITQTNQAVLKRP